MTYFFLWVLLADMGMPTFGWIIFYAWGLLKLLKLSIAIFID